MHCSGDVDTRRYYALALLRAMRQRWTSLLIERCFAMDNIRFQIVSNTSAQARRNLVPPRRFDQTYPRSRASWKASK